MTCKDLWAENRRSGAAVPVPETNAEIIRASNLNDPPQSTQGEKKGQASSSGSFDNQMLYDSNHHHKEQFRRV
jgi:hypothetical protein